MVACGLVVSCGSTTEPTNTVSDAGTGASGAVENGGSGGSGVSGSGGLASSGGGSVGSSGSSNGGAATGGATSDGGGASTMSPLAACRAYLATACHRVGECGGNEQLCLGLQDKCPDLYFSPGSNRQPGELVACGAAWNTFDCGSVIGGAAPLCVIAGSRATNESCVFAEQCQSLTCSENNGTTCGQCLPAVATGAACDATVTCPADEECMATCVKPTPMADPPPPAPPAEPGASCTGSCVAGYMCSGGTCGAAPAIGQPCTSACAAGAYCDAGTCAAFAAPGASCLNPIQCAPGEVCVTDMTTGNPTCKATRQVGEMCAGANDLCIPGAGCDQTGTCTDAGLQGFFTTACGAN
jgi:hypothetical protein